MDSAQDSRSQHAARWYARLRAPDCTPEERAQFEAWCACDPGNAAAYAAAERMSDALATLAMADPRLKAMVDRAASSGAALPDDDLDEPSAGKPPSLKVTAAPALGVGSRRRVARPFAWAASILAAALSILALLAAGQAERAPAKDGHRYAGARPFVRYSSGTVRRAITLEDGTRAYLDVASIIEVRFDATHRDVTLVQGRALFDAAHDSTRPFVVTVGADRVTALTRTADAEAAPSWPPSVAPMRTELAGKPEHADRAQF